MNDSQAALARLLFADGPAPDRADKMGLYGWLVGAWRMSATLHAPDGSHQREGEIAFALALEGRAILDVWALPDFFYGTTLRVYDPAIDAWLTRIAALDGWRPPYDLMPGSPADRA